MRMMIFTFLISVTSLLVAPEATAGPKAKAVVGKAAPDFFLRDIQGIMHKLSDIAFKGKDTPWKKKKKVLLDFFRTDCKPCMKELPEVVAFHKNHKEKVQVLMIALLEEEQGREKLNQWLDKTKPPFPVLVDAYETVAKKYIVKGDTVSLPSIFLIDENGIVRAALEGLSKDLESELSKSLSVADCPSNQKKK